MRSRDCRLDRCQCQSASCSARDLVAIGPVNHLDVTSLAIARCGLALGVTFTTREHVIAIEPRGKGLLGVTLRYPYEICREENYFGGLPEQKVPKEMLDLATHIIATRRGHFDPKKSEDHYETTLQELIKKKRRGETIERPKTRVSGEVINLMDALRKSIAAERGSKRVNQKVAARRHRPSAKRPSAGTRQAG